MKKCWYLLIFAIVCSLVITVSASPAHLADNENLLSASEAAKISSQLDRISREYEIDAVIVTADTLQGKSAQAFADDYFDYGGYGKDGVLLLVSNRQREWHISTGGKCRSAFTDAVLDDLEDELLPCLSSEQYSKAFQLFASHTEKAMKSYAAGPSFGAVLICIGIGLLAAFIVTSVMRGQLRSVRPQGDARSYVTSDLQLTQCLDLFMYRNVTRTKRAESSSSGGTHRSSSGRSHGGRGGRF